MSSIIKWLGILFGGAIGLIALTGIMVFYFVEGRLNTTYNVFPPEINVPTNQEDLDLGQHLVEALAGCQDCHGMDLEGMVIADNLLEGRIVATNLTSGKGGVGSDYSNADWVRAIRHGIGPDGKPLIFVSSKTLYTLSNTDLGAIIAYLKTLPPIDNELPATQVGLLSRVAILTDPARLPAMVIDHNAQRPISPAPAVSIEYGRYLTIACRDCHGESLTGGLGAGAGLDLSPDGDLTTWNEADFVRTLRTGITPDGYELDPTLMPWERIGKLTDDELAAIWLYLQTLTTGEIE